MPRLLPVMPLWLDSATSFLLRPQMAVCIGKSLAPDAGMGVSVARDLYSVGTALFREERLCLVCSDGVDAAV